MSIDNINDAISINKRLHDLLLLTDNIAIIEYNGSNIDGSKAIASYLDENDISTNAVSNIVLLGKKCKDLRANIRALGYIFPYANIVVPGKDWRGVDVKSLDFDCPLVLHMFLDTGFIVRGDRLDGNVVDDLTRIVNSTRRAFYGIFYKSILTGEQKPQIKIYGKFTVEDYAFTEDESKVKLTDYCLEKKKYLDMYIENISEKDSFFQIVDEVEYGCKDCNQCTKYSHSKRCPLAQRQVARCYREGLYVPQDDTIAHQWEMMAAHQGYKPARLQVADDLKDGVGCKRNTDKAIGIYSEYAHLLGNEDCADKIIDIVEDNDSCYDGIIALPHIVRKANAGDYDLIFRLAEAFRDGNHGLPQDTEQQKFWIEKGSESGETRFVKAMAEMYEEKEIWDSALMWYEKLDETDLFEDYSDKINEIEGKILQFKSLSPEEIADKGFAFLNGYGVEENHHLAYLCFEEAAKQENAGGERGLALCYEYGFDVEADDKVAEEWNVKAANHGNLRSMKALYYKYKESDNLSCSDKADEIMSLFKAILPKQIEEFYIPGLRIAGDCYSEGLMSCPVNESLAFTYYKKAADLGDVYSMYKLGCCYYKGTGTLVDYHTAFAWFLKAADLGDDKASYNTGYCYYKSKGVSENFIYAFKYFKKSADRGHSYAKYYLGECYILGRGTNRNEDKGYSLIEEAADKDCVMAMNKLCQDYFKGNHYEKNYERSMYWGEKALEKGLSSLRFNVAYSSANTGHIDRARELYTELANEGNISAMNNLGCLETEASIKAKWFIKAAYRGDEVAQCNIGRYYKEGTGVEQDYEKAKEYFERSATKGYSASMYELALLYKYGYGVDVDRTLMLEWFTKAIDKGNKDAMVELAGCYKNGNVVDCDYSKAMEYYMMAVELDKKDNDREDKNRTEAIYNIATMYENGLGVDKNVDKAILWYRKAANKNHVQAQTALKRLNTNWMDENGHATKGQADDAIYDELPF